jgi:hypothetical protein
MSIDLLRVPDATQSRFASVGARLPRVSGGEGAGRTPPCTRLLRTSHRRARRSGSVLSISVESAEGESMGDSQNVIDLTDRELGSDQLAVVIMRWVGGRQADQDDRVQ